MKRGKSATRDHVVKLRAMLSEYQRHPLPDMVQRATEELTKAVDLTESEQNEIFEGIERLAAREKAAEVSDPDACQVDEASVKLVALLKGELTNTREAIVLIRRWFYAKCRDECLEVAECIKTLCVVFNTKLEADCRLTTILPLVHLRSGGAALKHRLVPAKSDQLDALKQAFVAVGRGHELVGAFEQLHFEPWEFAHEPTKLLAHCTRLATNLDSILSSGMKTGVSGRLGPAVYLADIMTKCMGYCGHAKLSEDGFYGTIIVAEVATRIMHTTTRDGSVPGVETIFAQGSNVPTRECVVHFTDGGSSVLPIGPFVSNQMKTSFHHSEYAVRDTRRIRVRFVILFKQGAVTFPRFRAPPMPQVPAPPLAPGFFATMAQGLTMQQQPYMVSQPSSARPLGLDPAQTLLAAVRAPSAYPFNLTVAKDSTRKPASASVAHKGEATTQSGVVLLTKAQSDVVDLTKGQSDAVDLTKGQSDAVDLPKAQLDVVDLTKAQEEWDSLAKRVQGPSEPLPEFILHQKWLELIKDVGKRIRDIEVRHGPGAPQTANLRVLVNDLGDPRTKDFLKCIMFNESTA